jgi:hypothetical protein
MLVDTCVWLDLAKDPKQLKNLQIVEELIHAGKVELIIPRLVLEEFGRNKNRVIEDFRRNVSSTLSRAREVVVLQSDRRRVRSALRVLNDVDYKIPQPKDAATNVLNRVEALLNKTTAVETTDDIKMRALDRAMKKQAPFHRDKNSIGDALLIEIFASIVQAKSPTKDRFAFVTHNYKDFSLVGGNQKLPHPDIANLFSARKSRYFIQLGEALSLVKSHITQGWLFEPYEQQIRSVSDITDATDELITKIWYDRHQVSRQKIASGKEKIVDKLPDVPWPKRKNLIQRNIWEGALRSAAKVERRFGKDNLGPWSKFEWGMMNGKVSALRWVLGDEWDMLDN